VKLLQASFSFRFSDQHFICISLFYHARCVSTHFISPYFFCRGVWPDQFFF
jgi:hypothetical protein